MRQIKFRAWVKSQKRMIGVKVLDLSVFRNGIILGYELMQYTGLKDKNGTEIYEGDIVEFETSKDHYRGSVEFGKGMYKVKIGLDFYLNEIAERGCEVIGNIYENPDILAQGENT